VHTGPVAVKLTDEIRAGVISLPHGWGHAPAAPWQKVAGAHPSVSANDWTDSTVVESVVGQSVLNHRAGCQSERRGPASNSRSRLRDELDCGSG
jgi:hypothetical protein